MRYCVCFDEQTITHYLNSTIYRQKLAKKPTGPRYGGKISQRIGPIEYPIRNRQVTSSNLVGGSAAVVFPSEGKPFCFLGTG
jgi:hypothetical protein